MDEKVAASEPGFSIQHDVRGPWRNYVDELAPLRPEIFEHCLRLCGNIWDAEDLAQDALLRVFSLLGKTDANLENPKGYLKKTATNLWIDTTRRRAREQTLLERENLSETGETEDTAHALDARTAAGQLLQRLHPQERAALVLKDFLDFSLHDVAELLNTSVGAIKSALHRGRARLDERITPAQFGAPDQVLIGTFMDALRNTDLEALKSICATDLVVEMVGGAESRSFEDSKMFFQHAHFVMPELGFGENPNWSIAIYLGEPVVLGFRTLNGVEGINEVHRLKVIQGKISRVRCYCFCPDTLRALSRELGKIALDRPYRSPSPEDYAQ